MGVDFFDCAICKESVCDVGPYESCEECGYNFCKQCAPEKLNPCGIVPREDWKNEEVMATALEQCKKNCPVCSNKVVIDNQLLNFMMRRLGWDREQAIAAYREETKT